MMEKRRTQLKKLSIFFIAIAAINGCAPVQYVGGSSSGAVLVMPSKAWSRPNTTPKETYDQLQACVKESQEDPEQIRLDDAARKLHVGYMLGTKEQDKVHIAAMRHQGQYIENCIVSKGYKYGKVRPDQVYIPPPPPRSDWVKPGVSKDESNNAFNECMHRDDIIDFDKQKKCMIDKGFKWQVVDPHPSR